MALIAWSGTISVLTLFIGIMALGHSLNLPTVHSLISKEADPSRMGAMMGTAQGLSGLGRTIGPTWGGLLFGFGAGLPFILTSAILIITIWVGIRMWNRSSNPGSNPDSNMGETPGTNTGSKHSANTGAIRNPAGNTSPGRAGTSGQSN
jgi:MFS family permease